MVFQAGVVDTDFRTPVVQKYREVGGGAGKVQFVPVPVLLFVACFVVQPLARLHTLPALRSEGLITDPKELVKVVFDERLRRESVWVWALEGDAKLGPVKSVGGQSCLQKIFAIAQWYDGAVPDPDTLKQDLSSHPAPEGGDPKAAPKEGGQGAAPAPPGDGGAAPAPGPKPASAFLEQRTKAAKKPCTGVSCVFSQSHPHLHASSQSLHDEGTILVTPVGKYASAASQ